MILSLKQAAFIRNPEYVDKGTGPNMFTIGHDPFRVNCASFENRVDLNFDATCV
jgi:hypothetical protein